MKNAAREFVKRTAKEYGWEGYYYLNTAAVDDKDWFVSTERDGVEITDKWADFPSEEFRATLMLLGKAK